MLLREWNQEEAIEVWKEEAREEGKEEGIDIGRVAGHKELFALLESGVSLDEAKRKFGY